MLEIGTRAPDFSLPDKDGKLHSPSDALGRWLLIYFYPKDDTPGCTMEACALRDNFPSFNDLNTFVFGISADSEDSHGKFVKKHSLPFTLLADTKREVVKAYGAGGIMVKRVSYLIDPEGIIRKVYSKVVPKSHAQEVLQDLKNQSIDLRS